MGRGARSLCEEYGDGNIGVWKGWTGRWPVTHSACLFATTGVVKLSVEMLENGRFLVLSPPPGTGDEKASADSLLATASSPSLAAAPSFPSMEMILSASSLMYLEKEKGRKIRNKRQRQ